MTEDEVLKTIREWKAEVRNPRNDGWVQGSYADKLRRIRDELNRWNHEMTRKAKEEWKKATSTNME